MSEFIVVKEGTELKAYKTLPAAKKLADTEGAEVFHDGKCVYSGTETVPEVPAPEKYRLKALMNVRKEPSVEAEKLRTLPAGAVVEVASITEDWMALTDGSFVLYSGGKFAERI